MVSTSEDSASFGNVFDPRYDAPLFAAIACYLVNASQALVGPTSPHRFLTQLLAQATPLMLWLFAHALFERPASRLVAWAATLRPMGDEWMLVRGCVGPFCREQRWRHLQAVTSALRE